MTRRSCWTSVEGDGVAVARCAQDDALVIRLRAGDEQAYAELYRRMHPSVFGFALRRLGDPTEAEDVAQDVFLRVYRSIERFEGRSSLLCWIFGIARHVILDRFSRRSPETTPLDGVRGLAAPVVSIEESIDASRTWERCIRLLQRNVSVGARQIFDLRYLHGRSVEAIARETGKSAGAVKVGLMRTRQMLGSAAPGRVRPPPRPHAMQATSAHERGFELTLESP